MSVRLYNGDVSSVEVLPLPKTASLALSDATVVETAAGTGLLVAASATTTQDTFAGIMIRGVLTTDPDFATANVIGVQYPKRADIFVIDVGAGVPVTNMIGDRFALFSAAAVDLTATGTGATNIIEMVGIVSASQILGRFIVN